LKIEFDAFIHSIQKVVSTRQFITEHPVIESIPDLILVVNPECYMMVGIWQTLKEMGIQAQLVNLPSNPTTNDINTVYEAIIKIKPQYVLFRNRIGLDAFNVSDIGKIDFLLLNNKIKYASWFLDRPTVNAYIWLKEAPPNPYYALYFHASDLILPEYQFSTAHLLPGANPFIYNNPSEPNMDISTMLYSFVGQSRLKDIATYLQYLDRYTMLLGLDSIIAMLGRKSSIYYLLSHFKQIKDIYNQIQSRLTDPYEQYFCEYIWLLMSSAIDRLMIISAFESEQMSVFGDTDWLGSGGIKPEQYKGMTDFNNLIRIYQNTTINIHANFAQVAGSVCPKIFDILGCRGFVLTQQTSDLITLGPEFSSIGYISPKDAIKKAQFYIENQDKYHDLRSRLNTIVHNQHLLKHRVQLILKDWGF